MNEKEQTVSQTMDFLLVAAIGRLVLPYLSENGVVFVWTRGTHICAAAAP